MTQSTLMDETTMKLLDPDRVVRSEANAMESLDYDLNDSKLVLDYQKSRSKVNRRLLVVQMWVVTFCIGFVVAMFGVGMDYTTKKIVGFKVQLASDAYWGCGCFWFPYVIFLTFNIILTAFAAGMTLIIAPAAGGSGIPEVKCYLNGIKVPKILRLRTLVVKAIGTIFTVSGGLACGNEGPMIHIGSMVAAGISQGKSSTLSFLTSNIFSEFRNDHDKRDFVSGGAAAGISGAFGAPVGGTLFSLEEGSSFWNQSLTWRTFFCAIVASFTLNTFLSGISSKGSWSPDEPFSFQINDEPGKFAYTIPHVPWFIIIGMIGGLLGAFFNLLNSRLMQFRKQFLFQYRFLRWIEVIVIATLTTTIGLSLTYSTKTCLPNHNYVNGTNSDESGGGGGEENLNFTSWFCPPEYSNDLSSLFLGTGEMTVKSLLGDGDFSSQSLGIYALTYFFLACITLGVAAPSGLLVPCLAVGGAYGRLLGQLLQQHNVLNDVNLHTFALIGAASFLGGSARMTISLCVILIETTGSVSRGLPIMVTLMVAKWVGDWFGHSIYDIHIELKKIPMLEWDPDYPMREFTAEHIMNTHVISFYEVEKVSKIHIILQKTTHNGFPIISRGGILQGLILRSQLITLLRLRAFQSVQDVTQHMDIDLGEFNRFYPRFPDIATVRTINREDKAKFINLTPYMNMTPFLIQKNATVERVFRLFRTMGLRHLPVIDDHARVVGIITRRDLVYYENKIKNKECKETHLLDASASTSPSNTVTDDNDNGNGNGNKHRYRHIPNSASSTAGELAPLDQEEEHDGQVGLRGVDSSDGEGGQEVEVEGGSESVAVAVAGEETTTNTMSLSGLKGSENYQNYNTMKDAVVIK